MEKTPNENAEPSATEPVEQEKIPTSENPKYKDWELTYLFGTPEPTGKDLTATFYWMKHPEGFLKSSVSQEYYSNVTAFVKSGWDVSEFDNFYHSPSNLYAQCIAIPRWSNLQAPFSFGESDYRKHENCWVVHCQGKIMHKDGITFRFWGASDPVLTVAINKKVVLAANFNWDGIDAYRIAENFHDGQDPDYTRGAPSVDEPSLIESAFASDWITLSPGQEYDFDAVVGSGHTGHFFAMLMVEVLGENYEMNDRGEKILPLFATQPLSWEVQDSILMNMDKGDCDVTGITSYFMVK
ncbi:MAG: hypothetical protein JXR40_05795 [Pontiellaceae bacterium]|nr:hypothetical protein [Pontiellaceae bacterium]